MFRKKKVLDGEGRVGGPGITYNVTEFMKRFDIFSMDVPSFNVKGDAKIRSSLGSFLTTVCVVIVLIYSLTKSAHLQSVNGQTISTYTVNSNSSLENPLNLSKRKFRMAVSFEGVFDEKLKDDAQYVRWFARLSGFGDDKRFEKILKHHKCTDEDYEQFFPIIESQRHELQKIREDPERGMICVDWDDAENPIEIAGDLSTADLQNIEFFIAPCNYRHTMLEPEGYPIDPRCNYDKEA